METQLRKDILAFLTPLLSMQTENGRRALLLSAGLETILMQTDLSGSPGQAVPLLVNALELYGTIETGEPALVVFLQEIARQVGQDKQRQIQDFCERLTSLAPAPPQETPPRTAPQTIISQGDYFENVGGNIYTGPVTIHQGDIVGGDKVGGDKVGGDKIEATVGDVSGGSQVAIGKEIHQTTTPAHATPVASSPRPVPQDAPRVFICYAREDLAVARRVYTDLQQAGVKPWMDSEDLLPGQNWKLVITRAIKESKYLIALLSSRSLSKRGFVQKEMREAWNVVDELPPEEIFIIPVRLDECTFSDERLQDLHHVDLFPSYEEGLQRILRSINVLE